MRINFLEKLIGSGLYSGYSPVASGTVASFIAMLIYYIPGFEQLFIIIPVSIIFLLYGIPIGNKFEKKYGKDPAECTIDEFVGMWISLIALPKTIGISMVTFIIWRVLDIVKPFPARKLEKIQGGLGIMIDDVASGIYTLLIVHVVVYLFGKF